MSRSDSENEGDKRQVAGPKTRCNRMGSGNGKANGEDVKRAFVHSDGMRRTPWVDDGRKIGGCRNCRRRKEVAGVLDAPPYPAADGYSHAHEAKVHERGALTSRETPDRLNDDAREAEKA
jgi:hypothetical protein